MQITTTGPHEGMVLGAQVRGERRLVGEDGRLTSDWRRARIFRDVESAQIAMLERAPRRGAPWMIWKMTPATGDAR